MSDDSIQDIIATHRALGAAAQEFNVSPELLASVVRQESGFNPAAVSPKGAIGLGQLMPGTAKDLGVNPYDTADNARGSAHYLRQMLDRFGGDEKLALAAYNAGPGAVEKAHGVPNYPETQHYVQAVQGGAGAPAAPDDDIQAIIRNYRASGQPAAAPAAPAAAPQPIPHQPNFGENLLSSAGNFVGGLANSVIHLDDTAKNLGKTALGLGELALPESAVQHIGDYRPNAYAVGNFYKQRYGGWENIKKTAYEDPVGVAADLASILYPAEAALEGVNVLAKSSTLGRVAGAVGKTAQIIDPMRLPSNVARIATDPLAERIIASNLKTPPTLQMQDVNVNVPRVVLNEGFGPGKRGFKAASETEQKLVGERAKTIADAGNPVLPGLPAAKREINKMLAPDSSFVNQANPQADLSAIQGVKNNLLRHPKYSTPVYDNNGQLLGYRFTPTTAAELDELKTNTYAGLKGKYGKEQRASLEAEKAGARGIKQTLDANIPGYQDTNTHLAQVIAAKKSLQRMIPRETNKYPLGLMEQIGIATGVGGLAAAGHPIVGGALPLAVLALKHPTTAFPIAKGINLLGRPSVPLTAALTMGNRDNAAQEAAGRPVSIAELLDRYRYAADHQQPQ